MYTNALMGTALDRRHVWRPAAKEGLDRALKQDEYAALACECGEQEAIHEPDSEGQQHLRLVPVRDVGVETLADFLVHPGTSEQCARCAASTLGLEWPPEQADARVENVEDPEYVAKEVHGQRAAQMYEERYGDRDAVALEDGEVGDEIQAFVEGELTEVVVVRAERETAPMTVYDGDHSYTCHAHEDVDRQEWVGPQDERTADAAVEAGIESGVAGAAAKARKELERHGAPLLDQDFTVRLTEDQAEALRKWSDRADRAARDSR